MTKGGYIYILTNKNHTVLYTGVTSNLVNRIHQHKTEAFKNSFTSKYNTNILVYFEMFFISRKGLDIKTKPSIYGSLLPC